MNFKAALVIFFCDAKLESGLGHLSRCITLANALKKRGALCKFVINAPTSILKWVKASGYSFILTNSETVSQDSINYLKIGVSLLIIDSKKITNAYIQKCRRYCPVVIFDDEMNRELNCDILINNNIWANYEDYQNIPNRLLLIGTKFNTVNPVYFELREQSKNGLLITFGGEDPYNHTALFIKTLGSKIGCLPTHVCIGPSHPNSKSVIKACQNYLQNFIIYQSPVSLVKIAARCHIALSAAGTTCYELVASGLAVAALAVERHQEKLLGAMESAGILLSIGVFDNINSNDILSAYVKLNNVKTRKFMIDEGSRLFSSPGDEKIMQALIKLN